MSKTRKVVIIVEAQLPKGIGTIEFRDYVNEAVCVMCKSKEMPWEGATAGDPLFYVDKCIEKVCYISVNWLRGYLWKRWPALRWPI